MEGGDISVSSNSFTSIRPEEDRTRYRKSCNTCTRAKKKCDGGCPCKYCAKWSITCVYAQRLRPGPSMKTSRSNSDAASSSERLGQENLSKNQLILIDVAFIRYFIMEMNTNIPLLSPEIFNTGVRVISNVYRSDLLSPQYYACASLTWQACALGAYLCNNDRLPIYTRNARDAVSKCFDFPDPIVAKAFLGMEVMKQITDNDFTSSVNHIYPISKFISHTTSMNSKYVSKETKRQGLYQALGEVMLSLLRRSDVDYSLIFINNIIRTWNFAFAESNEELNQAFTKVETLTDEMMLQLPNHIKIPAYTLNVFVGWQLYFKNVLSSNNSNSNNSMMNSNLNPSLSGAKYSMNHIAAYHQDCSVIRMLENSDSEIQDPMSYFILLGSVGMHAMKLKDVSIAYSTMFHAAQFLINRPSILNSPIIWRAAFTVASVLYYVEILRDNSTSPTSNYSGRTISESLSISAFSTECRELCRILLFRACSLRRVSRNMGDENGFSVGQDVGLFGEISMLSINPSAMVTKRSSVDSHQSLTQENAIEKRSRRDRTPRKDEPKQQSKQTDSNVMNMVVDDSSVVSSSTKSSAEAPSKPTSTMNTSTVTENSTLEMNMEQINNIVNSSLAPKSPTDGNNLSSIAHILAGLSTMASMFDPFSSTTSKPESNSNLKPENRKDVSVINTVSNNELIKSTESDQRMNVEDRQLPYLHSASDMSSIRSEMSIDDHDNDRDRGNDRDNDNEEEDDSDSDSDSDDYVSTQEDLKNSSFRSLDTGITSLDSLSGNSLSGYSATGNSIVSRNNSFQLQPTTSESSIGLIESVQKLSTIDTKFMAIILNLHLYGLVDEQSNELKNSSLTTNQGLPSFPVLHSKNTIIDPTYRKDFLKLITAIHFDIDPISEPIKKHLYQADIDMSLGKMSSMESIASYVFSRKPSMQCSFGSSTSFISSVSPASSLSLGIMSNLSSHDSSTSTYIKPPIVVATNVVVTDSSISQFVDSKTKSNVDSHHSSDGTKSAFKMTTSITSTSMNSNSNSSSSSNNSGGESNTMDISPTKSVRSDVSDIMQEDQLSTYSTNTSSSMTSGTPNHRKPSLSYPTGYVLYPSSISTVTPLFSVHGNLVSMPLVGSITHQTSVAASIPTAQYVPIVQHTNHPITNTLQSTHSKKSVQSVDPFTLSK